MLDLGTLGGNESTALALNTNDEVVGDADTAEEELHAFRYAQGRMQDINPAQAMESKAYSLNATGEIIGQAQDHKAEDYTWLLSGSRQVRLNSLSERLNSREVAEGLARIPRIAINNHSQFAINSYTQGKFEALLISPR
jgi:probable HAF family extracellular repeat protein